MLSWFAENLSTILIGTALAVVAALIIVQLVRNRRRGKTSCGCGCRNCPMNGDCHSR